MLLAVLSHSRPSCRSNSTLPLPWWGCCLTWPWTTTRTRGSPAVGTCPGLRRPSCRSSCSQLRSCRSQSAARNQQRTKGGRSRPQQVSTPTQSIFFLTIFTVKIVDFPLGRLDQEKTSKAKFYKLPATRLSQNFLKSQIVEKLKVLIVWIFGMNKMMLPWPKK